MKNKDFVKSHASLDQTLLNLIFSKVKLIKNHTFEPKNPNLFGNLPSRVREVMLGCSCAIAQSPEAKSTNMALP